MYVHGERDGNDLPVYNTRMCGSFIFTFLLCI